MVRITIVLIVLSISRLGIGQSLSEAKVPRIIPPSADATALGKFADIPVGLYTGIPNISIPVTTVHARDINMPLSFSYHASGVKVEEEASWVGLGWTLEGIPTISRTTRGNNDFSNDSNGRGYIYSNPLPESNDDITDDFLKHHCVGNEDGQPDIFYYNILGHTGKFFLKKKKQTSDPVEVVLLSNKEKIKINYNEDLEEWTIITNDGMKFVLGAKEYTQPFGFSLSEFQVPDPDYHFHVDQKDPKNQKAISTWYASKIISPLKEEIFFEYKTKPSDNDEPFISRSILSVSETSTDIRGIGARWSMDLNNNGYIRVFNKKKSVEDIGKKLLPILIERPPSISCGVGRLLSGSFQVTYHLYPESITFQNGKISFHTSDRSDISEYYDYSGTNGAKRIYSKPQKLDYVEVTGNQSSVKIQLEQDYFNNNDLANSSKPYEFKRLKLNRLTESSGGVKKKPYTFTYNGDAANGSNYSLPAKNSFARDHWGFYNGAEGNVSSGPSINNHPTPTMIPAIEFERVDVAIVRNGDVDVITEIPDGDIQSIPGANRNSNESVSVLGTLKSITYPTGGNTEFVYESNTFNFEDGALVSKDFFYTADQVEFEVPSAASVTISSELKCHNCFGNQDNSPCLQSDIKDFSKVYFEVIRVSDGERVFAAIYSDYYEKLYPAKYDFPNVDSTPCGIQRTEQRTLTAGKYIINTYGIDKFKPHGYVSFTAKVPAETSDIIRKGGGIRIQKMIDHDGINPDHDIIKTYDYTWKDAQERVLSTGRLMSPPIYTYYGSNATFSGSGAATVCATFISDSYSNIPLGSSAQGSAVGYDKVTVTYGINGENGKSVHYFMNDPDILNDFSNESFFPNSPTITHAASNGLLLKEEFYTSAGTKNRETLNGYNKIIGQPIIGFMTRSFNGCQGSQSTLQYHRYKEPSEWWFLSSTYEKTFDVQDPLGIRGFSNSSVFTFSEFHKQVIETQSKNSAGESVTEKLFYPFDTHAQELAIMYDETVPNYKHIHNALVKREVSVNSEIINGTLNNYKYHSDLDRVLLENLKTKQNGGDYQTDISIDIYDEFGNALQATSKSGIPSAYIWGYNSTLLIAEAINANWDQIFYTSFEEEPSQLVADAITGARYHSGDYLFTPPSYFNPSSNSVISYWYWQDGEWKYEVQPYSGGSVLLDKGDRIDEVRVYPAKAQLTTYTHDPLRGITSSSDANNQTTYYEYDKLGRLVVVRDFNKNILKHFDYQYKK